MIGRRLQVQGQPPGRQAGEPEQYGRLLPASGEGSGRSSRSLARLAASRLRQARNALISQLRSLEPPLSEDDIDLERRALDAAIERLEVEHGGIPAPANDAAKDKPETAAPPPPAPPAPKPVPEPIPQPEPAPCC